jgi:hypothetical protein
MPMTNTADMTDGCVITFTFSFQTQTKEVTKLFEMALKTFHTYNVPEEYHVEKFFDDVLVVVHPDYRKLGIAHKFIHLRYIKSLVLKTAMGLPPVTSAVFLIAN